MLEDEEMDKKRKRRYNSIIISIIAVIIIVARFTIFAPIEESEPEIINKPTLERIINVSDLSTFEAVYNGIAKIINENEPDKVDYYVSYEATVKAGINFENVDIDVDNEKKIITVKIPEVKINDINVDITSLDYIFENEKANISTVSEEAYKKCIEDVTVESNKENEIYELAKQNAKNIIEALISPFVEQFDNEYQLQIN